MNPWGAQKEAERAYLVQYRVQPASLALRGFSHTAGT
jgi:hypothetical protein